MTTLQPGRRRNAARKFLTLVLAKANWSVHGFEMLINRWVLGSHRSTTKTGARSLIHPWALCTHPTIGSLKPFKTPTPGCHGIISHQSQGITGLKVFPLQQHLCPHCSNSSHTVRKAQKAFALPKSMSPGIFFWLHGSGCSNWTLVVSLGRVCTVQ